MIRRKTPAFVSIHGGHSGDFCNHAENSLEEIINSYIQKGFSWIGIAEHMPPVSDDFLYPEEKNAGLDSKKMYSRFASYFSTCRALKENISVIH